MSQEYQKRKLIGCFQRWLGVGQVMVPMCSLHFPLVSGEGTPGFLKDKFFSSHSQTLHQSAPWKWGQLFCGDTSNSVVLNQRHFLPHRGNCYCLWTFLVVMTRDRYYWPPVDRDQGCCWTSYNVQGRPLQHSSIQSKISVVLVLRIPVLPGYIPHM